MATENSGILEYATTRNDELTYGDRPDGGIAIIIPTRRGSWSFIAYSLLEVDIWPVIFTPFLWLVFKLFATRKPRAIIELTRDEFALSETSDDGLGYHVRCRSWPRRQIGELRKHRFQSGLYLRLPGVTTEDLLSDLSNPVSEKIGQLLSDALARLAQADSTS